MHFALPLLSFNIGTYINTTKENILNLTKSKERVSKHGEVFTPKHIVDAMIALIPDSSWADKTQISLEPTCGNGNFVVEIVKKKISCGLSIYEALNTTFGMDIMEDNIQECHERLYSLCETELSKQGIKGKTLKKSLIICLCIIMNNVFVVEDSLQYIKDGRWDKKKFFETEPSAHRKKHSILEEYEDSTVLSIEERNKIVSLATELKSF